MTDESLPQRLDVPIELQRERTRERYSVLRILSGGVVAVAIIYVGALWALPWLEKMVSDIAGKDTNFNAAVNITIALTLTLTISVTGMALWVRSLKKQLRDQRDTINDLQRQLQDTPRRGGSTGKGEEKGAS